MENTAQKVETFLFTRGEDTYEDMIQRHSGARPKGGRARKSGEEQGRAEEEQRGKRKSNHDHKESACYPMAQS